MDRRNKIKINRTGVVAEAVLVLETSREVLDNGCPSAVGIVIRGVPHQFSVIGVQGTSLPVCLTGSVLGRLGSEGGSRGLRVSSSATAKTTGILPELRLKS
jgi:hypothetical protein